MKSKKFSNVFTFFLFYVKVIDQVQSESFQQIQRYNKEFLDKLRQNYDDGWIDYQRNNLNSLYTFIQKDIFQERQMQDIEEVAGYLFQTEGKIIRPLLNMLYYEFLKPYSEQNDQIKQHQITWSAVIEILHVSSLIHDDILDQSDKRRGQQATHLKYGAQKATFGANFMVGRAGKKIADFNNINMYKIYAKIMDNLTNGEYLQARKIKNFSCFIQTLQNYLLKTYFKTSSLIANSLLGVSEANNVSNKQIYQNIFYSGLHLGISFQLIDDVLDYTSSTQQLGKQNMNDLKSGVITGPVLLEYYFLQKNSDEYKLFTNIFNQNIPKISEIDQVNQIVMKGNGIERTKNLAYLHADRGIQLLEELKTPENYKNLKDLNSLIFYILNREK